MGARSYICIEQDDGKYKGVYCHNDGYLDYNGRILFEHYNQREKVVELIKNGDMSSLGKEINPDITKPHNFVQRQSGVCVFYGRDRGEDNTKARIINLEDVNNPNSWIEYCYIYTLKDRWIYFECGRDEEINLIDLGVAMKMLDL